MKKASRESWLALALIAVLLVATIVAVVWQTDKAAPPALSSASNEPDGARALWLWLVQMGYTVSSQSGTDYQPPAGAELIFVLEPFTDSDDAHWKLLDDWINAGGTLIAAGVDLGADELFQHFNFRTNEVNQPGDVTVQSPLIASPPLGNIGNLNSSWVYQTERDDFVSLLAEDSNPILVTFRQGAGRVILASFVYPFTNSGLKQSGNPELVLNLLALAGKKNSVWIDEWHHGISQQSRIAGPEDWLRFTPAGHALLFIAVILFLALLLQGRGFGRPMPLPRSTARRPTLEYITALANLNRRAGHRAEVLQQYYQSLKGQLARRYRLSPALPDNEYVQQLARYHPGLDTEELQHLLNQFHSPHISEAEMVKLAAQTAEWLKKNL